MHINWKCLRNNHNTSIAKWLIMLTYMVHFVKMCSHQQNLGETSNGTSSVGEYRLEPEVNTTLSITCISLDIASYHNILNNMLIILSNNDNANGTKQCLLLWFSCYCIKTEWYILNAPIYKRLIWCTTRDNTKLITLYTKYYPVPLWRFCPSGLDTTHLESGQDLHSGLG